MPVGEGGGLRRSECAEHRWHLVARIGATVGATGVLAAASCSLAFGDVDELTRKAGQAGDDASLGEASVEPYSAAVLSDQPVAYFRFEQPADAMRRDERGGLPANLISTKASTEGVRASHAVDFDGVGARVDLGPRLVSSGNAAVAFELWFSARSVDSKYPRLLSVETGADATRQGWVVALAAPRGLTVQRYRDGAAEGLLLNEVVQLSKLQHVVVNYDGAELVVYVDGRLRGRTAATRPLSEIAQPLVLGRHSDYGTGYFDGVIDEVAVYRGPLDPGRISAHFELGRTQE